MPQIQTVDFTPRQRTETTPFEKFIGAYGEAASKRIDDNNDIEGLINVYKKHKETGGKIEETIQNIFTQPGLSPTARVNAANQMFKMEEINQQKQKQADAATLEKIKATEKEYTQRVKDREKQETTRQKYANKTETARINASKAEGAKQDLAASNRALLSSIPGITTAEVESFAPESLSSEAARAIYTNKTKGPGKTPSGERPVPEDTSAKIAKIVRGNPDDPADELAIKLGEAGVEPRYATPYIENRRRQDESKAKNEKSNIESEEKRLHEYHKESAKYDEKLRTTAVNSVKQLEAVKDLESAVDSGNVKPLKIANIFRRMGNTGQKIADAFTNADQGKFDAAMPLLLEGWKDVFGVRLSDADIKILENKLPGIGKSPAANKAILGIIEKYAKPNIIRAEVAKEIKAQNKGLRPLNFAEMVEEETNKRMSASEPVFLIAPSGKKKKVPRNEAQELLNDPESGWKKA